MAGQLSSVWLPRFLFGLCLSLSAGLLLLVLLAPFVDNGACYLLALRS